MKIGSLLKAAIAASFLITPLFVNASDVMGNGLSESLISEDCIGNCYGTKEINVEAYLGNTRELIRLTQKAMSFNAKKKGPNKFLYNKLKKEIKCYVDNQDGRFTTEDRIPDVEFHAKATNYQEKLNKRFDYRIKSSDIKPGLYKWNARAGNYVEETKYIVGDANEVLEVTYIKNRETKNVHMINYKISQCRNTSLNDNTPQLSFGTGPNNLITHSLWPVYTVGIHFDGSNGRGVHYFHERADYFGDRAHSIARDLIREQSDQVWGFQVKKAFANLRHYSDDLGAIDESIEDIFLLLLIKYREQGMDKKEVLRRARLAVKNHRDLRYIENLINEIYQAGE